MGAREWLPWDGRRAEAAGARHLEMLKWARENAARGTSGRARLRRGRPPRCAEVGARNDCPWSDYTCAAAEGGHLDVLKWLRENGCPWDEDVRTRQGDHFEVLKGARAAAGGTMDVQYAARAATSRC